MRLYQGRTAKRWTEDEKNVVRQNRHLRDKEIMPLLPGRTEFAIKSFRSVNNVCFKQPKQWTAAEDALLKQCYSTGQGPTEVQRSLPRFSLWEIGERAKKLRVTYRLRPLIATGHPIVDAIRQRAREDGFSMRQLDRELGGIFFSNDAVTRSHNGHRMDWNKINQALDFFDAKLVNEPDGSQSVDWQDA